jgi:nicotinamidase-related amidase
MKGTRKTMPSPTALLCIDMQYIHVHPDFSVSGMKCSDESKAYTRGRLADVVLPNAQKMLKGFREKNALIVHIVFNYQAPDGSDMEPKIFNRDSISGNPDQASWSIQRRDHPLSAIMIEVAPKPGEIVLEKVTHSAFGSTNLNNVMINHEVETIVHIGGLTSCCVKHTALDARKLGYKTVCVPEACVDRSDEAHQEGVQNGGYNSLLTVEEALALLK